MCTSAGRVKFALHDRDGRLSNYSFGVVVAKLKDQVRATLIANFANACDCIIIAQQAFEPQSLQTCLREMMLWCLGSLLWTFGIGFKIAATAELR